MLLSEKHLERYADVLIWGIETARLKPFKPYDKILLRYEDAGLPLVEKLFKKLVQRNFHVIPRSLLNPVMETDFYQYSDSRQRRYIGNWEPHFFDEINGNIFISAPSSLIHLKNVDPDRINDTATARKKMRDILQKREERGLFGWTLCTMPTAELASRAGITEKEYARQIIRACFLDMSDPVKKWSEIHASSEGIKRKLDSIDIETIRLESENCDLTVKQGEKRRYLGVSGHNIPSFEIFTSPDWRGANGIYFANLPSYRSGNYVKDVRLEFKNGSVVNSSASEGEKFLRKMLSMDAGARRIGEFSLTDRRFSKINRFMADTLFDENFGGDNGNSHIAVGMSYSDSFRGNPARLTLPAKKELGFNDSALHWDLVNTEKKRVTVKTKKGKTITIYEDGIFKV